MPFLTSSEFLIRFLPFISALSIALIASGIENLKQYRQELLLLLVLAVPLEKLIQPVNEIFGVATLLTKISTFILWYIGFEVTRQGETIILPMRATWVSPNCAGTLTILWMLQLAALILVIFPTTLNQKILVPVVAVSSVLLVNGIRIAIMAVLAAYDYSAFEYWHSDKFQIFSTIPILLFGLFCRFLIYRK